MRFELNFPNSSLYLMLFITFRMGGHCTILNYLLFQKQKIAHTFCTVLANSHTINKSSRIEREIE